MKTLKCSAYALFLIATGISSAQAQSKITLVAEDDWYPYTGVVDKQTAGLSADLIKAAYTAAGAVVEYKIMPYARGMDQVKNNNEIGVFNTPRGVEVESLYLWHKIPVMNAKISVFSHTDYNGPPVTVDLMKGKTVGTTNGYPYTEEFDKAEGIKRDVAPTDLMSLKKLAAKRTDYAVVFELVAGHLIASTPDDLRGKIKTVGILSDEPMYVSFAPGRADAKEAADLLDKGLAAIKANGTYDKIWADWQAKLK